jgi:hypothetical protein
MLCRVHAVIGFIYYIASHRIVAHLLVHVWNELRYVRVVVHAIVQVLECTLLCMHGYRCFSVDVEHDEYICCLETA